MGKYIETVAMVTEFLEELSRILSTPDEYVFRIQRDKAKDNVSSIYTTRNTMLELEYDVDDVIEELRNLQLEEYLHTIKDNVNINSPEFRVFGKYILSKEIYIKVKIEDPVKNKVFCISFHFARFPLEKSAFKKDYTSNT